MADWPVGREAREAKTRGPEGTIVDWLIGWPVGKGEANERGLEDWRAGGPDS